MDEGWGSHVGVLQRLGDRVHGGPTFLHLPLAGRTVYAMGKAHSPSMKPCELPDAPGPSEEEHSPCPHFHVPPMDTNPIQDPCSFLYVYFQC